LIIVLLAADARLARRLSGRMDALLAGAPAAAVSVDPVSPEIREAVGAELMDRAEYRPDRRRVGTKRPDARRWDFIEEDVDVGTKDPR
jgi:hypothetical protein